MAKKVWCYTLFDEGIEDVFDIGSDDEVQDPKLHHLYECDPTHPEISDGSNPYKKLYYVSGFPIDVYKLQEAIRNFNPVEPIGDCNISIGTITGTEYILDNSLFPQCIIFKE